jgi:hypothetical protein
MTDNSLPLPKVRLTSFVTGRAARGPSITIPQNRTQELDAPPTDGTKYYGIDKVCTISPTAGLADPISTSRRRE